MAETDPNEQNWQRLPADEAAIEAFAAAIKAGECGVLPTDTVYGIAANPFDQVAVEKLLAAKQRGKDMPSPLLIAEPGMMRALATNIPTVAQRVAKQFWPGALTIILRVPASLDVKLGETKGTIALRVPDHDFTRALLRRTGPLAVSSANLNGQTPATTIDEAIEQLGDNVSVYLDGGECASTEPSTIVDFSLSDSGKILRPGAISFEQLQEFCPSLEDYVAPVAELPQADEPEADEPAPDESASDESAPEESLAEDSPEEEFEEDSVYDENDESTWGDFEESLHFDDSETVPDENEN